MQPFSSSTGSCMCMGFGCNAAGVIACRIIDSPRERLIAILTNNFAPCNGRFPTLILLSTLFVSSCFAENYNSLVTTLSITSIVLLGIATTFFTAWFLSKTLLKGTPSSNILELPPYRLPQVGAVIYRSIIDRTFFVLKRAVYMAAPAGAVIWLVANIPLGDTTLLSYLTHLLDAPAYYLGVDGVILLAFILGLPANEIVVPIMLMAYLSTGQMIEIENLTTLKEVFLNNHWTLLTAINTMLLCLLHYPCSTTLLTIHKETGSKKWTAIAFLLPTVLGLILCLITTFLARTFGLFV